VQAEAAWRVQDRNDRSYRLAASTAVFRFTSIAGNGLRLAAMILKNH
jgi:hypothetical protein